MSECEAVTKRGKTCSAHALKGSPYCYMHSPEKAAERSAARKLGGMRRGAHAGELSAIPLKVRSIEDVMSLLDYCMAESLALDNGIQRSRVLILLSSEYLKALETSEIEARLEALEEAAHVKKG